MYLVTSRLPNTLKAKRDPSSQASVVVFIVTIEFALLCTMPKTPL